MPDPKFHLQPEPAPPNQPRSGYLEVEHVRDVDGVLGIISRRIAGAPIHSIGIFKEFDRDGVKEKSTFWEIKRSEAVLRVLAIIVPRARELEKLAMAEYGRNGGGRR